MEGTLLSGRYRLVERVSIGGPADIWRCVDETDGQTVAAHLVTVPPNDPDYAARVQLGWTREMRAIDHPGVTRVHESAVDPVAGLYVIAEFVDGPSLARVLAREGRLSLPRALEFMAQLGDALQAVHDQSVVHGDLRPGLVDIRSDGTFALSVFGLEVPRRYPGFPLAEGVGRLLFWAPEQCQGERPTRRSDIFSLGALSYMCLSGRRPFEDDGAPYLAIRILREPPPPLPDDVPPSVRSIVERALAKEPEARWPTAAAFAAATRSLNN